MAEQTGIEWCDATFNPWIGCEKVSPGCAHCYAETLVHGRMGRGGTWGAAGVRQVTSPSNWKKPLRWARLAREGKLPDGTPNPDGHRPRVFCASLADVFENRPELREPRDDLFTLIEQTPELDWLLLTKRPEFAREWIKALPFGEYGLIGFTSRVTIRVRELGFAAAFPNVWMGTSIENARHTWRANDLRQIPAAVRFLSCEPLLGSLFEPGPFTGKIIPEVERLVRIKQPLDLTGIDWVIVGGESGRDARPMHPDWAREIRDACFALGCGECGGDGYLVDHEDDCYRDGACSCSGVQVQCGCCNGSDGRPAFFFKQWGEWTPKTSDGGGHPWRTVRISKNRTEPPMVSLLPDGTRYDGRTLEQWLAATALGRVGKKRAGRELDGRTWNEFPASAAAAVWA